MALLTSGSSTTYTGTTTSATVAVTAGAGSRKLIVGFAAESAATVTALTFNGQDLLPLIVDLTDISTDGVSHCVMYEQFDAGLPASGSHDIAATFSGSATGGGRMFYWLVDGVRQDQVAEGASGQLANGGTSVATFQTDETFASGLDGRVLCSVGYRNDNATSLLLTTPSSATNVADVTVAGGGRVSGSHKVGSMGTGTIRPTWTTQATNASRRTGAAIMLNPVTAAALTATAAFTSSAATAAATASRGREASASFSAGSATASATLTRVRQATASFLAGAATLAASAVRGHPATASFTSSAASLQATAEVGGNKTLTASFQAGAATLATTASLGRDALAAFQAGAASLATTATVAGNKTLTAAFAAGGATFAATATRARQASASFAAGPASWFSTASVPEPGTGQGNAFVVVPKGPALAIVPAGPAGVSIPSGPAGVLT